ncbi:MAG: tRNA (adenosine(37)-N6)-dimethylallyltransferase MiaA [Desulfovibrionaceae bacterium]|jgi:tRNA dimethylallyltransferase|nr:tRNA (adenosine(37)-N6)-dimethylallyltransferase MiaA [Desulfovibrionaceae bacterium]
MPVCILLGPTGAGKTAAALHMARRLGCGVVNFDSRQIYRDFPIVTAQPTAEERAVCPHRLYGFLDTAEPMSAGAFTDLAARAIDETVDEGLVPVLVGGTGLYLRTLLEGIAPIPPVPAEVHERWIAACAAQGPEALHRRLAEVDPGSAARLHPNDRQRITRALEVFEATGRTLTWWHARPLPEPRYRALKIGVRVSMAELEPVLATRIERMLEAGALDEARAALARCPDRDAPGWSGIGCAELYRHLAGEWTLEETRARWFANTRAYARRQFTWFRKEPDIHWRGPREVEAVAELAERFLAEA